jgi:hypothetical protein
MSSDNRPPDERESMSDKRRSVSGPAAIEVKVGITRKPSTQHFDDMLKNLDVLCDKTSGKTPSQSGSIVSLSSAGASSISRVASSTSSIFAQMTDDLDAHIHRPFSGSSSINSSRHPSTTRLDSSSRLGNSITTRNPSLSRQDSLNNSRSDIPNEAALSNTILNAHTLSEGLAKKESKKSGQESRPSGQSFVTSPRGLQYPMTESLLSSSHANPPRISGLSSSQSPPFDLKSPVNEKVFCSR